VASRPLHLVRRFFDVLTARPLDGDERAEIEPFLTDADRDLFWLQDIADQRHALETARTVRGRLGDDREAVRAALFHDVGKIHSRLGPFRRSMATALGASRAPLPERYRAYLDHGPRGAVDLAERGAENLVVAFARHHPGPAPSSIDPGVWQVLLDADAD
jgi:hypothetical protein